MENRLLRPYNNTDNIKTKVDILISSWLGAESEDERNLIDLINREQNSANREQNSAKKLLSTLSLGINNIYPEKYINFEKLPNTWEAGEWETWIHFNTLLDLLIDLLLDLLLDLLRESMLLDFDREILLDFEDDALLPPLLPTDSLSEPELEFEI